MAGEQTNRKEWYFLYSPCFFSEQIITACLKCLGYDDDTAHHPPTSHAEREIKFTGDEFVVNTTRSSMASRRPPRPPLSSGGGGQINESSS